MTNKYLLVAEIIFDIEKELRELQLWDVDIPTKEALESCEPFAVDTLSFPQWLQFIFIPRLYFMIEQGAVLPSHCGVAPMAEQYFQGLRLNAAAVIAQLHSIDKVLSEH